MSNFFLTDRIKELSRTDNTGPIILDGAAPGFSAFSDFFASGDVIFYAITDNVDYEVGSGVYQPDGSNRSVSRFPFRSSKMNVGPYFIDGSSNSGPTNGSSGNFYPLWLTRSAAQSGVGFTDGPYTDVMEHTFDEYPGVTFYMPSEHQGHGTGSHGGISGANYASASSPVDFNTGVKEVFVTYPGKTSVLNGYGLESDTREPKNSGIAFWRNEQLLNYSSQLVWDDTNNRLGVTRTPEYSIDIGGAVSNSIIRASGFVEGGSGIAFSGGATTYTGDTASGGTQYEPFLRNENGSGTVGVIELSGVVNQYIGFAPQIPGTIFAGPETNHCGTGSCPSDYPTFRLLTIDDIPLAEISSSGGFIVQRNDGIDSQSSNISPNNFTVGMVGLYGGSGQITYDSGIFFDAVNNRLLVGGNASTDTPTYSIEAVGSLGADSGYFNQILFTDDLVRIGNQAGTNSGNLVQNFWTISIGDKANLNSSGVFDGVSIGFSAGRDSENNSGIVLIGNAAGFGLFDSEMVNALGKDAAGGGSGLLGVVAIGQEALYDSSGIVRSYLMGNGAGRNSKDLLQVVGIGDSALRNSSDIESSVVEGQYAGMNSRDISQSVILGRAAGSGALELNETVLVGSHAGASSSGTTNVYIGLQSGSSLSGNKNIEIVSSGTGFLGSETSNKINIEQIIVGDSSSAKVAVGHSLNANPGATLTVLPSGADDIAFIIQHQGSGSSQPYVQLQSGDGTTFYQITNSGDVITSGYMVPSGGLHLPNVSPTQSSGVGGLMLWNNNNTLVWNGTPIGGGGFTGWSATSETSTGSISDGQEVIFSGVSGIGVSSFGVGNRSLLFDGSVLSGICLDLSGQIAASDYHFYAVASGVGTGNNDPKLMDKNSYVVLSGVNGIDIDFIERDDGTNSSGIFELSYNPSAFYSFFATNGEVANDQILDEHVVTISGVSGIRVEYSDAPGGSGALFNIAAPELSGVLQSGINDNTTYLSNEFGPISVSGVSGVALWASGEFARVGIGSDGTSGIKLQDNKYIIDPTGIGNLKVLNFPDGIITIRSEPVTNTSWRYGEGSIIIGSGAGVGPAGPEIHASNDDNVVAIGTSAMAGNAPGDRTGMVILGYEAFKSEPSGDTSFSIAIGRNSLSDSSGIYNIGIGKSAGEQNTPSLNGRQSSYNIAIGCDAGKDQDGDFMGQNVSIGSNAGTLATSGGYNLSIGDHAGYSQDIGQYNTNIGYYAGANSNLMIANTLVGYRAGMGMDGSIGGGVVGVGTSVLAYCTGAHETIAIGGSVLLSGVNPSHAIGFGSQALKCAENISEVIAIGSNAGESCSGVQDSVFIGPWAGYKRSGDGAIIISNHPTVPAEGYDAGWSSHDLDMVIDIGHAIQGTSSPANLHVGAQLNNSYRTSTDITSSALNITPDADNNSALKLNQYSVNGTSSTQNIGLLKTQTKYAGSIRVGSNDIVNKDGYLVVPRATGVTGSSPNKELIADGVPVTRELGVVSVLDQGATKKLCVVLFNTSTGANEWYATSSLSLL